MQLYIKYAHFYFLHTPKDVLEGFRTSKELVTSVFIIYIHWVLIIGEAILENRI